MARRRKKSKKWLYWALILVLLIVAGVVVYFVWNEYFRDDKKEDGFSEIVEEEKKEDDKDEKGAVEEEVKEKEKETVMQYEGESPNTTENLTGVITYAAVNGDTLLIRVNIDQYLDGGSCELSLLQNGGVKYSDSVNISSITTATCEGFNVPMSSLGSGNYQIIIKIDSNGKNGTIKGEANI